jgi:hypothetical protein
MQCPKNMSVARIAANVTFGPAPHDFFDCAIIAPVAQGLVLKASNRRGCQMAIDARAYQDRASLKRY